MLRQVIQVESVYGAVKDQGVLFYADMVLQEQAGGYFFIDVDMGCPRVKLAIENMKECDDCEEKKTKQTCDKCIDDAKPKCGYCIDCIKPIPVKIAYFIIQAINLQNQAMAIHI